MIAVDTSALIAILFDEPEAEAFIALIEAHDRALVGTPTALEFRMVALRQANSADDAAAMLGEPPFEIMPFGKDHGAARFHALRTRAAPGAAQFRRLHGLCGRGSRRLSLVVQGRRLRTNRYQAGGLNLTPPPPPRRCRRADARGG